MRAAHLLLLVLPACTLGLDPMAKDSGGLDSILDQEDEDDGGGGGNTGTDTGLGGPGGGADDGGDDCVDQDGDGVDTCSGDCDDDDADTFPGAAEKDGPTACMRDADGDGWGDADVQAPLTIGSDCDDSDPSLQADDLDGDGSSTCDGDCDDNDSRRSPQEPETPFDGVDSDCDGQDGGTIVTGTGRGGMSISDYNTITSTASIGTCDEILDFSLGLDLTHSYRGDLTVTLFGPVGTTVRLHDRGGGSADHLIGTYAFSGGTLAAVDPLTAFYGNLGTGTWTLTVKDNAGGDTGTLNSWSLTLWCR
jgi:subtilisin-like proprotein convertase family protein